MYRPLTTETVVPFARSMPAVVAFFGDADALSADDLADGNVNLVFRVRSTLDSSRTLILKQALPHARRYPDFKMPLDRARIERVALDVYQSIVPGIAPRVIAFDEAMSVTVMEDLSSHRIMRESMATQREHASFAPTLGRFLGRTMFYTSDFALASDEKKRRVVSMSNPVLCKVTEDLVFTFPFVEHPTNRFPKALSAKVADLHANRSLLRNVAHARHRFMSGAEAMVHGDLHTGSLMVSPTETRVIDPEFGFYGPIGFDPGMLVANLAIATFAQDYHAPDADARRRYRAWLAGAACETFRLFKAEFAACWSRDADTTWRVDGLCDSVLAAAERDALLFCGCEMVRRTIGMAHVSELDDISDESALVRVSANILDSARLALTGEITSIDDLVRTWNT